MSTTILDEQMIDATSLERHRPRGRRQAVAPGGADALRIGLGRGSVRVTHGGEVARWLGPAMRGMIAGAFKRSVCRFDLAEQQSRRRYCSGCPHVFDCSYGVLYEPDPGGLESPARGDEQAPSGVVVSPCFPVPARLRAGDRLSLEVLLTGSAAVEGHWGKLFEAITMAATDVGIGPDHVRFSPDGLRTMQWNVLTPETFPADLAGGYPALRIDLLTPLILRAPQVDRGPRRAVTAPTLLDLFRPAIRIVRRLFAQSGVSLDRDWSGLCQLAEGVERVDHTFEAFSQRRWSSRTRLRTEAEGVVGSGWYRDVPAVLVPWLYWGGRLHAGGQRVAGAGRWRMVLE